MDQVEYNTIKKDLIFFGNSFNDNIGKPNMVSIKGDKLY